MGIAPRRAARIAAVALASSGGLLLLGTRPVAATQPPPPTASTAIELSPGSGVPGTSISVNGQGFAPAVRYTLTLCPAPACAPGAPAQKCQVSAASNTGTVLCNVEIPQGPPGDAVVTVYQDIAAGSPAATACPSAMTSPLATIPALPSPPAALPSAPAAPPAPLPAPGDQVTACVRQASAVLTVLPDGRNTVLPPPAPVDLPAAPVPLAATVTIPTESAPPAAPAATRAPAKVTPPRRSPIRPVAVGLPLRSLLPGTVLAALGAFVFAGSLIPAPAPAAPCTAAAAASGASRLRRFVQTVRR